MANNRQSDTGKDKGIFPQANPDTDSRIAAFVRFLARRAAERDFKNMSECLEHQVKKNNHEL